MATWIVVPSLQHLLAELNAIAPNRDKSSDGSIGDTSHSARPSGHNPDESGAPEDTDSDSVNEVRARDFDKDLKRPGLTMEMVAQLLVEGCRAGRITWIKYIIYNKRIWAAKSGWVTKMYNGANPHDKHMHVSSKPDTASENNTKPLKLETLVAAPKPVKEPDDMNLTDKTGDDRYPNRTLENFFGDFWALRDTLTGDPKAPPPTGPLKAIMEFAADYPRLKAEVAKLSTGMAGERAEVPPTLDAIAEAVVDRLEQAPEITVNVSKDDLKGAILDAVHSVTARPTS